MRSPRRDGSDAESATLPQMWLAGHTAVAIGIALGGRGAFAVRSEIKRMGLPRRAMDPHHAAVLVEGRHRGRIKGTPLRARMAHARQVGQRQRKGHSQLLDAFPPVRFIDFDRLKQCHFIEGEPAGADTLMCGRPIEAGSYCKGHRAICVMPEVADGR